MIQFFAYCVNYACFSVVVGDFVSGDVRHTVAFVILVKSITKADVFYVAALTAFFFTKQYIYSVQKLCAFFGARHSEKVLARCVHNAFALNAENRFH